MQNLRRFLLVQASAWRRIALTAGNATPPRPDWSNQARISAPPRFYSSTSLQRLGAPIPKTKTDFPAGFAGSLQLGGDARDDTFDDLDAVSSSEARSGQLALLDDDVDILTRPDVAAFIPGLDEKEMILSSSDSELSFEPSGTSEDQQDGPSVSPSEAQRKRRGKIYDAYLAATKEKRRKTPTHVDSGDGLFEIQESLKINFMASYSYFRLLGVSARSCRSIFMESPAMFARNPENTIARVVELLRTELDCPQEMILSGILAAAPIFLESHADVLRKTNILRSFNVPNPDILRILLATEGTNRSSSASKKYGKGSVMPRLDPTPPSIRSWFARARLGPLEKRIAIMKEDLSFPPTLIKVLLTEQFWLIKPLKTTAAADLLKWLENAIARATSQLESSQQKLHQHINSSEAKARPSDAGPSFLDIWGNPARKLALETLARIPSSCLSVERILPTATTLANILSLTVEECILWIFVRHPRLFSVPPDRLKSVVTWLQSLGAQQAEILVLFRAHGTALCFSQEVLKARLRYNASLLGLPLEPAERLETLRRGMLVAAALGPNEPLLNLIDAARSPLAPIQSLTSGAKSTKKPQAQTNSASGKVRRRTKTEVEASRQTLYTFLESLMLRSLTDTLGSNSTILRQDRDILYPPIEPSELKQTLERKTTALGLRGKVLNRRTSDKAVLSDSAKFTNALDRLGGTNSWKYHPIPFFALCRGRPGLLMSDPEGAGVSIAPGIKEGGLGLKVSFYHIFASVLCAASAKFGGTDGNKLTQLAPAGVLFGVWSAKTMANAFLQTFSGNLSRHHAVALMRDRVSAVCEKLETIDIDHTAARERPYEDEVVEEGEIIAEGMASSLSPRVDKGLLQEASVDSIAEAAASWIRPENLPPDTGSLRVFSHPSRQWLPSALLRPVRSTTQAISLATMFGASPADYGAGDQSNISKLPHLAGVYTFLNRIPGYAHSLAVDYMLHSSGALSASIGSNLVPRAAALLLERHACATLAALSEDPRDQSAVVVREVLTNLLHDGTTETRQYVAMTKRRRQLRLQTKDALSSILALNSLLRCSPARHMYVNAPVKLQMPSTTARAKTKLHPSPAERTTTSPFQLMELPPGLAVDLTKDQIIQIAPSWKQSTAPEPESVLIMLSADQQQEQHLQQPLDQSSQRKVYGYTLAFPVLFVPVLAAMPFLRCESLWFRTYQPFARCLWELSRQQSGQGVNVSSATSPSSTSSAPIKSAASKPRLRSLTLLERIDTWDLPPGTATFDRPNPEYLLEYVA